MKKTEYQINYIPGSISFAEGFLGPKFSNGYLMVLDRKKANKIIKSLLKEERNIIDATIGLDGDWRENNELIYVDKKFHKDEFECYPCSLWATPKLIVTFTDEPSRTYEIWKKKYEKHI